MSRETLRVRPALRGTFRLPHRRRDRAQPGARRILHPVLQWQDRPLRRAGRGARSRRARRDPRRRHTGCRRCARLLGHLGRLHRARHRRPGAGHRPVAVARARASIARCARQTGWNWSGRNDCFRLAPHEFGGIEFHADALVDCHWEPTLTLDHPARSQKRRLRRQAHRRGRRGIYPVRRPRRLRRKRRSAC